MDGTAPARPAVQVDRDRVAQLRLASSAVVAGGLRSGWHCSRPAGRSAAAAQSATGCSGIRTATVPSVVAQIPDQRQRVADRQTMVSPPGQNASRRASPRSPRVRRPAPSARARTADQHRQRHVPAPALGREQPATAAGSERVGADPVDRVGRQHDQLAAAQGRFRGCQSRSDGAGSRSRSVRCMRRHPPTARGPGQTAVTNRSRPARSWWLRVSRQPRSSAKTQCTEAPCGGAVLDDDQPPGRSSRRAARSTTRTASSPSAPPHSAAGRVVLAHLRRHRRPPAGCTAGC